MKILLISLYILSNLAAAQNTSVCIEKLEELKKLEEEKKWDDKQKYMLIFTGTFLADYRKKTKLRDERIRVLKMELKECK